MLVLPARTADAEDRGIDGHAAIISSAGIARKDARGSCRIRDFVAERSRLWAEKTRSLERAGEQFQTRSPDGIHDLRVALRRISATANAVGRVKLARKSQKLVRSLSELRQLEVDRRLLGRVRELGLLPPETAAGIELRWDERIAREAKDAARVLPSELKSVRRKVSRLARRRQKGLTEILEEARRQAEKELASVPARSSDRSLHRYRIAVKRVRYVAEDLAATGRPGMKQKVARVKRLQDALGRWNDLRLFRLRLARTREEGERRGAVALVSELDRLLEALGPTLDSAKREAFEVARRIAAGSRRGSARLAE